MTAKQEIHELVAENALTEIVSITRNLSLYTQRRATMYSKSNADIRLKLLELCEVCERLANRIVLHPDNGLPIDDPAYESYLAK